MTTTACNRTPAKSVPDRAPMALRTPYSAVRSTVMSAKKSATTMSAITTVTPMIWLKTVRCCDRPGSESIAWAIVSVEVAPPVARSIASAVDSGSDPTRLTTRAWTTWSPTRAPGRFAASTERHVSREPQSDPCPW